MKKTLLFTLGLFISTIVTAQISKLSSPRPSPFQKTEIRIGVVDVSLEYSRPSMKGRKVFGELVPYDKFWRTGADKNTKFTFSDYVVVGGVELAPGVYTMFTKPNKDNWDIYFHSLIDEYGVPDNFTPENSVAQLTVPVVKLDTEFETLKISFENLTANSANLKIAWENTQVSVLIKIPTEKIIITYLSEKKVSLSNDHSNAAFIFFDKEKNSQKALLFIEQSIAIIEENRTFNEWLNNANIEDRRLPYNYYLKSQILEDLNKRELAIESAKKSLIIAEKIKSEPYKKMNLENIEKWSK